MIQISANDLIPSPLGPRERGLLTALARHAVRVQVEGRCVVVSFDEPESAARFAQRYRDLDGAGGTDLRAYAARDESGCTHFWTSGGPAYTWPHGLLTPAITAFFADAVAIGALLRAIPAAVSLHAAALYRQGRAFAITGSSTAGKSTTAVACVAAGCDLYSDERTILTPNGVAAFPRALNLRSGGIELLVSDLAHGSLRSRLERRRGSDWNDVGFAELFESSAASPPRVALSALFVIGGHDDRPHSRRMTAVEALPRAQLGAITAASGIDRVCAILEKLAGVACFELILGSPQASALHIFEVVDACAA